MKDVEKSGQEEISGLEEYNLRKKKKAIWTAVVCVLAVLMVVGVDFALRSQGRAYTGEPTCGKSEHSHSADCYENGDVNGTLICESEEHTHDDSCYESVEVVDEDVVADADAPESPESPEPGTGSDGATGDVPDSDAGSDGAPGSDAGDNNGSSESGTGNGDVSEPDADNSGSGSSESDTNNSDPSSEGTSETAGTNEGTTPKDDVTTSEEPKETEGTTEKETETGTETTTTEIETETETTTTVETTETEETTTEESTEPELTYEETSRTYEDKDNGINVEVSYPKSADIPDQAELIVKNLTGSEYKNALKEAENALGDAKFDAGAIAYDISFVYDGKEIEPKKGSRVTVTFHFIKDTYEDGDELTVVHVDDNNNQIEIIEGIEVDNGKSAVDVDSFSPYIVGTTRPVDAQDISDSVKNIEFSTREGSIWVKKNKDENGQYSFNSDDSIKAVFSCESIPVNKLGSGAYIPLPKSISLPAQMIGKKVTYSDRDYSGTAGTYQLLYDTDGAPCASFAFTDDYLKWIRKNRGGRINELYFDFEFTWDVGQTDGTEKKEDIYLGDFAGTVAIKTKDQLNDSNNKLGYNAYKNVKETKYENGKMIITYEVYVNVEKRQEKEIVLKDTITWGTEFDNFQWEYSGRGGSHADDYVKLTRVSDTEKTITIGNKDGADEGTYTIRYTASFDIGDLQNAKVDSVKNTIDYDDDKYHSSAETDTRMNPMTKSGSVVEVNTGEVKWTVRINDGRVPYTFGQGESFTDTLPAGTSLVEDTMKIIQYDANWKEIGNVTDWHTEKKQDGTTLITVNLPQGAYRYQLEYVTKQDEAPEPGVETKVENKAEIKGDVDYETSAGVTLKPDAITKTMGEVLTKTEQYYTTPDGTKRQVFEVPWSVMLASVKAGEEYTDRAVNASWTAPLIMSPEQIAGIVVKCGENPLTVGTDYTITSPDGSEDFLFKIKFLKSQKAKVTIDYTCYADVTDITEGGCNVRNVFGSVEAGGWIEKKFQSTSNNLFKYVKGSGADEWNRYTDSKITIGMNKTLNWVIVATPNCIPESPLVFKDTLPKGLRFVDGSLKITADWGIDIGAEYYQIETEKGEDGNDVFTLTVDLTGKEVSWKDYGTSELQRLEITYDTVITDTDFLTGSDQSTVYTNTVEWDGENVEQNVTVTRDVIGKNGSFNEETGMLRYSVIINPDGADLNPGGDLLRVEDTLTDRRGVEFTLGDVKLYRLTSASDGSGKKVPGEEIATLEQLSSKPSDGSAQENTYYYDASTYTITAYIPDETGCALVYGYQIMSDVAEDIYVSNKASLYGGSKSFGSTQESTKVLKFSLKAGVSTQAVGLYLEKRDAAYNDKLLAGAEFEVSRWDETERNWVTEENNPYVTNENGSVALSSLAVNTVYMIRETKAPEGYEIDSKVRYFVLTNNPESIEAIPDGVKREDITLYPYGKDVPVSVMQWVDYRNTKLFVEKKWVDGSQKEIERINGVLTFDLYRKKIPKAQAPASTDGRLLIYELTDEDLEKIKADYEGYKTAHADEFVAEYTMDNSQTSSGVWRLVIPVEQSDNAGNIYQYYVVETSMDTLSGNDQWLKAEYAETFDDTENLGGITITNTIVSEYALPETGGRGSWTDRVAGWFQDRYQNIVHYFRKEEK